MRLHPFSQHKHRRIAQALVQGLTMCDMRQDWIYRTQLNWNLYLCQVAPLASSVAEVVQAWAALCVLSLWQRIVGWWIVILFKFRIPVNCWSYSDYSMRCNVPCDAEVFRSLVMSSMTSPSQVNRMRSFAVFEDMIPKSDRVATLLTANRVYNLLLQLLTQVDCISWAAFSRIFWSFHW